MKQVRISRDVVFDDWALWYLHLSPTPINSIPNSEDEIYEAEMPLDKEEIDTLEKSLISFRLSGPNEGLNRSN